MPRSGGLPHGARVRDDTGAVRFARVLRRYRHPAVLANAIATIDHLIGGRADMGLGAGWAFNEYEAYGIPFPSTKVRLDILEEAVQCVRLLLREEEVSNFDGQYFQLKDARCEPRPVQAELPIWVGGGGEKRTLAIVAKWADGWNVPFISPEEFARKREVLAGHCATADRDVDDIKCAVNVGLAFTEESLKTQFGALADAIRPGVLNGSDDQWSTWSAVTPRRARRRSTSRCGRRSSPRNSNASRPPSSRSADHRVGRRPP